MIVKMSFENLSKQRRTEIEINELSIYLKELEILKNEMNEFRQKLTLVQRKMFDQMIQDNLKLY